MIDEQVLSLSCDRYYKKAILKIGGLKEHERISASKLGLTKGAIKNAYDKMREISFKGQITEFVSFISLCLWMKEWKYGVELKTSPQLNITSNIKNDSNHFFIFSELIESYLRKKELFRAGLKLANQRPDLLFLLDTFKSFFSETEDTSSRHKWIVYKFISLLYLMPLSKGSLTIAIVEAELLDLK